MVPEFRILLVVPVARVNAVVNWFSANIAPGYLPANIGPGLNATGNPGDAITHRWCGGGLSDADTKKVILQMCDLAGVTRPTAAQWDNATKAQRRTWLLSVQAAIRAGFGIFVVLMDHKGNWDNPQDTLASMGLKTLADS